MNEKVKALSNKIGGAAKGIKSGAGKVKGGAKKVFDYYFKGGMARKQEQRFKEVDDYIQQRYREGSENPYEEMVERIESRKPRVY